ncbi:MAG: class II aldolase/adducin family protein [Clostridia bacterium]|nr:class II aldolase/adducin family protein [Clostridia bacterium]
MFMEKQRKKIIQVALKFKSEKLAPLTFGNFSLKDKETECVAITPSNMEYSILQPQDIIIMNLDGKIIDGCRKPSIETPMHLAIYKKRPDVGGIVHTHSSFATAWASTDKGDMPAIICAFSALVGQKIKCAPYKPMGTKELADVVSTYIQNDNAVLMANHGTIAVGPDVITAYTNAVVVEENAKTYFYASQFGNISHIK